MKILATNRHGGKSTSDLVIITNGGADFNVLNTWIDAFFAQNKGSEFRPGTGNYLTMIISKEIRNLIHPLNDNPKHYLDLDYNRSGIRRSEAIGCMSLLDIAWRDIEWE